ncbi:tautomerase family protein [Actinoplanes sp. NPDC023714]|uniref:tautomerase family protein n=1 Tax=Actinoplanes sp. NPDC023714 TaxID=3154322 RepID=UPI0033CF5B42
MPHLTVHALDTDLTGREPALIAALTDAVAGVYGEWARPHAHVLLVGVPAGRWGIGGVPAPGPAPAVTFGIRADALTRPDTPDILARLAAAVTDATAGVLGDHHRPGITVDFTGREPAHSATGGRLTT